MGSCIFQIKIIDHSLESYKTEFNPEEEIDLERPLKFQTTKSSNEFKKKLSSKIEKHMDIVISYDKMFEIEKLSQLVHMQATCQTYLPWIPGDGIDIDLTDARKGQLWLIKAIKGFIQTVPSDYWYTLNDDYKEHDK